MLEPLVKLRRLQGHVIVKVWCHSPPPLRRRETLRAAWKMHRRPKLTATTVMTFDLPDVQHIVDKKYIRLNITLKKKSTTAWIIWC